MKSLFAITMAALIAGCTHSIHLVNTSGFDPYYNIEDGTLLTARSEQFVFLWLSKDTRYVEAAYKELISQCVGGEITGLTTQLSTSHGFLSWTNKVLIQGRCYKTST